jgi:hypothetical protein
VIKKIPFQQLGTPGWQNLALVVVLVLYGIRILFGFNGLAAVPGDYICFWSAGRLANEAGYARVYDLNALYEVQKSVIPSATVVQPMFYLPVFILPFQILTLIPIVQSYWLWVALNLLFLIFYIRLFIIRIPASIPKRTILMTLVVFPVFVNFYSGQVNLLLMLAVGEFIHALIHNRPVRAGIWLALLLLKPQTLILILPVLLFQRNWKTIVSFGITSVLVGLLSFALIGAKGLDGFSASWLVAGQSNVTVAPENMMNWRMIAVRLGELTTPLIGWFIAGSGIASSLYFTFAMWRKPISPDSPDYILAWFGTIAATLLLAWHSHAHMAVILIPMLLHLKTRDLLSSRILNYWFFLPYVALFIGAVFISIFSLLITASISSTLADFFTSLGLLIQCFYFLMSSYLKIRNSSPALNQRSTNVIL